MNCNSSLTTYSESISSLPDKDIRLPLPHPGQVAPETPAVPQTGHSIGTAPRMVPSTIAVSVTSHILGVDRYSFVRVDEIRSGRVNQATERSLTKRKVVTPKV